MTKKELVALLVNDRGEWNRWRADHPKIVPDLRGANLVGCDLSAADLGGVNLSEAVLFQADLRLANLSEANLSDAQLTSADLSVASLDGANLKRATLGLTTFSETGLERTDFSHAIITGTRFLQVDLRKTKGLERAICSGPANIDVATIYLSHGQIPKSFLRDAGVPEDFIRFIPSLIGAEEGIQFYSCFISYSHKDEAFAQRLFSMMRDAKLRVWYAPEEMKGGQKLHEQIETAIRIYDKLLVVLSEASLASEWVKTEIRNARRAEKVSGKRKLFPVRLVDMEAVQAWREFDTDTGKDLGVELREYFIPDFSEWKDHDKFKASFKRLLRDLKEDPPPIPAIGSNP